jgi:hypothetical protein
VPTILRLAARTWLRLVVAPGPGRLRQPPRQALLAARRVSRRCVYVRQTATLPALKPVINSPAGSPPYQRCEEAADRPVHSDPVDMRSSPISAQNAARHTKSALCALITGRHLPCRLLNSRELICQYIAFAADPDGTFAIARMQPCFRVAVKIATVVAARPKGRLSCRQPSRLRRRGQAWLEHPGLPASRSCCTPVSVGPAVSRRAGDGVRRFAVVGVAVQVRGGSVIFDPLTGRLAWLCRLGKCPGRTP